MRYHVKKREFDESTHVKVRLLTNQKLDVDFKVCQVIRKEASKASKINKIIIHIHGGGFVCQDSAAHQNYTR